MKVKKKPRARVIIAAVNAVLIIAIAVSAVASYIISYKDRDESSVSSQTAGESKKSSSKKDSAATAKDISEAFSTYREFLEQDSIEHGSGEYQNTWYLANCQFAVANIDSDGLPELFLYDTSDSTYASGYGILFTYKDGKIHKVCDLSLGNPEQSGYYKKTGWFVDNGGNMGGGQAATMKLKGTSAEESGMFTRTYKFDDSFYEDGSVTDIDYAIRGSDGEDKTVKKSEYESKLSKATGGKKLTKCEFHDNYSQNRDEYLK